MKKILTFLLFLAIIVNSYADAQDSMLVQNFEPNNGLIAATGWPQDSIAVVTNPDKTQSLNTSDNVIRLINTSQWNSVVELRPVDPVSIYKNPILKFKVYSNYYTSKGFVIWITDVNGFQIQTAAGSKNTSANINKWEDYSFDLSSYLSTTAVGLIKTIDIFIDRKNSYTSADSISNVTNGYAYYIDDIRFAGEKVSSLTPNSILNLWAENFQALWSYSSSSEKDGEAINYQYETKDKLSNLGGLLTGGSSHYNGNDSAKLVMFGDWGYSAYWISALDLLPNAKNPNRSSVYVNNIGVNGDGNLKLKLAMIWAGTPSSYATSVPAVQYSIDGGNWSSITTETALPTASATSNNTGQTADTLVYNLSSVHGKSISFFIKNVDVAPVLINYLGLTGSATFADSIKIFANKPVIIDTNGFLVNGTLQLFDSVWPKNANQAATWFVSKGKATIDGSGLIKATEKGDIQVTTVSASLPNISNVYNYSVFPLNIVDSIHLYSDTNIDSIKTSGGTLQIKAKILPDTASFKTVTWSLIKVGTAMADLSNEGLLKAIADGIVYVKAMATDGSNVTDSLKVTIMNQVGVDSVVIAGGNKIDVDGAMLALSDTVYPKDASVKTVKWITSDPNIISVDKNGLVTPVANGIAWVKAVSDLSQKADSVEITVTNQWSSYPIANKLDIGPGYVNDYRANIRMLWSDTALLMKINILDDTIYTSGNEWTMDNTEIYVDMNNSKRVSWPRNHLYINNDTTFDSGDHQMRVIPGTDINQISATRNPITGVTYNFVTDSAGGKLIGYHYFLAFPFDSLMKGFVPAAGKRIGFDILTSDNDGNPDYRNQFSMNSPTQQIFNDPSLWATLELQADHTFKVIKDVTPPSTPQNPVVKVDKGIVTATWDPSTDNIAVWSYEINVTGSKDTTFIFMPTNPKTNTDVMTNAHSGDYTITIVAVDNFGNKSKPSAEVKITVNNPFDLVTFNGDIPTDGEIVTVGGKKFLKVRLNGWSTSFPVVPLMFTKGEIVQFSYMYGQDTSSIATANVNAFVQFMKSGSTTENIAVQDNPASAIAKLLKATLKADTIDQLQLAGQNTANGWKEVYGSFLYISPMVFSVPVTSITISGGTSISTAAGTIAMIATITPDNATDKTVAWSVDMPSVATIDAKTGKLTAVGNGTVVVTATANDGSKVKATSSITVSGQVFVPTINASSITLYPNPVSDVLHLSNTASINRVEIFNSNGQVVLMLKNTNGQMDISTVGLNNGVYILRAYTGNNVISKQFVK